MPNYGDVFQVGCSILVIILIGFFTCRYKILPFESVAVINKFLLKACYFSLMARSVAVQDLSTLSFMPAVVGICANITMHLLLTLTFLMPVEDRWRTFLSSLLPTIYVNYLIVGFPVFNAIWPEKENVVISVMTLSNDVICVPVFLILVNIYEIRQRNKLRLESGETYLEKFSPKILVGIVIRVITNPIVIGNILGVVYAATKWEMCPFLWDIMKYLADSVLGLSLFCVGGFLSQHSLIACHWVQFAVCAFCRHVVFPGLIAFFGYILGLSGRLCRQCVLMACNPSATASYLISDQANMGPGVASTMIFWTTMFAVPMQILWLFFFEQCNFFPEGESL